MHFQLQSLAAAIDFVKAKVDAQGNGYDDSDLVAVECVVIEEVTMWRFVNALSSTFIWVTTEATDAPHWIARDPNKYELHELRTGDWSNFEVYPGSGVEATSYASAARQRGIVSKRKPEGRKS